MSTAASVPDPARVQALLAAAGCPWPAPLYVETTGSTNTDARELAEGGAVDGTCLVAGEQTVGRGRHGRSWVSQPGAGLWSSTIVRGVAHPTRLPIVAALAVVDAAEALAGLPWRIKWPNDVWTGAGRKVAGILIEATGDAAIVGIGINVGNPPPEFAHAGCWVDDAGEAPDRSELLAGLLVSLHRRLGRDWSVNLADYRECCVTLGAQVRVVLPDGDEFSGTATDLDEEGHLLVQAGRTVRKVIAGDVLHATIAP